MAKSFDNLTKSLPADRQEKIAARTDELLGILRLGELRRARELSQETIAERLKVRQAAVSKVESRSNLRISTLRKHIEAMGGKLVYAIIPAEGKVDDIVMNQARKRAKRIIKRTRAHMALEAQSEGLQSQEEAIEELAEEMAREMARDFWK